MKYSTDLIFAISFVFLGCGGGEEFSVAQSPNNVEQPSTTDGGTDTDAVSVEGSASDVVTLPDGAVQETSPETDTGSTVDGETQDTGPKVDSGPCTPIKCTDAKMCGGILDKCGGVAQCPGKCYGVDICGGGGVENQCGCTKKTVAEACTAAGHECGTVSDGCGGTVECGKCLLTESCNPVLQVNKCRGCHHEELETNPCGKDYTTPYLFICDVNGAEFFLGRNTCRSVCQDNRTGNLNQKEIVCCPGEDPSKFKVPSMKYCNDNNKKLVSFGSDVCDCYGHNSSMLPSCGYQQVVICSPEVGDFICDSASKHTQYQNHCQQYLN